MATQENPLIKIGKGVLYFVFGLAIMGVCGLAIMCVFATLSACIRYHGDGGYLDRFGKIAALLGLVLIAWGAYTIGKSMKDWKRHPQSRDD
jgi:hypothetical protein